MSEIGPAIAVLVLIISACGFSVVAYLRSQERQDHYPYRVDALRWVGTIWRRMRENSNATHS